MKPPSPARVGISVAALLASVIGKEGCCTDGAQSIATIRSPVDRGVTLIDTAPVYGFGRSEEIVARPSKAPCAIK
jgi:aryl-alcohol dehydrogenase-like predicted oxidoreductase